MVATGHLVGAVLSVAGALTAFLTAFGWRHREELGADWFAATMGGTTVWIAGDLAGVAVGSRVAIVALDQLVTVAVTVVPVCWFGFVLAYTGRDRWLDRRGLAALWAVPTVLVAGIVTAPFHTLYHTDITVTVGTVGPYVESAPGPLAWLNLAYFALLVGVGLWVVAKMLWNHDRLYANQAVWLLVGTLAPVSLLALSFVVETPGGVPVIAMGFPLLGLAYAHGLFSHRLFDLSPATRRIGVPEAFDDLGEGVVVVDTDRDVAAINEPACELFGCRKSVVLGGPVGRVSPALADLDPSPDGGSDRDGSNEERAGSDSGARADSGTRSTDVTVDGRVLSVSVSAVRDGHDRLTGHALVVRDVTADRRRQERLDVLNRVFRHNIRNTMNAVVGPTDMLVDRLDGEDHELAETAHEAGQAVLELSESVREVERMMTRPVEPQFVSVPDAIDGTVRSVRGGASFTVETDVPAALTLSTDPRVLALVLEQVVENAVVHAETDHPTVSISAEPHDDGCLVRVTDEGPGIPDSELAALRDGTETQLAHGSGIGLWTIHWGTTRVGGSVRFQRRADGTRVTLWFPGIDGGIDPRTDDEAVPWTDDGRNPQNDDGRDPGSDDGAASTA